jgi:hypothetical protein
MNHFGTQMATIWYTFTLFPSLIIFSSLMASTLSPTFVSHFSYWRFLFIFSLSPTIESFQPDGRAFMRAWVCVYIYKLGEAQIVFLIFFFLLGPARK